MALVTTPRNLIVTIGQSLNSAPDASGPQSLFGQIRDHYVGRARTERGHIPGIAWLQWKRQQDWAAYYEFWAAKGVRVIFNMCGGSTDYSTTANRTGTLCYTDEGIIANQLRAYGPQVKVIGSTTNPSIDLGVVTTTTGVQDVTTFAGAGVLNVASTAQVAPGGAAFATGTVKLQTGGGTGTATITYTSKTATTFTGCSHTAGTGSGTTTTAGGWCYQLQEWNRRDGNSRVMTDGGAYFDAKVDYAAVPQLVDPGNTTYYQDGTHPSILGQTYMFAAVQPAIDGLLL